MREGGEREGSVGEWFIPEVLKTSVLKGTVGSNPAASAKKEQVKMLVHFCLFSFCPKWLENIFSHFFAQRLLQTAFIANKSGGK